MKSNARWVTILACRVLANAIVGGFWFAIVGAFCGGVAGAFLTFIVSLALGEFGISMVWGKLTIFDAIIGFAGGIMGIFVFAIAAWRAKPGQFLSPFHELKWRVSAGQALATLLACLSFLSFEFLKMKSQNAIWADTLKEDGHYLLLGAPLLMICGAIAAALTKRDT